MRGQMTVGLILLGMLAGMAPAAQPPEKLDELETVVITGEQPGPGLWKVSKGDHVMWVLASFSPLPKDMIWRSKRIEARIAESQEVLYAGPVNVSTGVGLFRGLTLIPAALKAGKIPDKKTLKDVLAPETYRKWLALRQKYIGKDDDVEKWRPAIALEQLRGAAFNKSSLRGGQRVNDVVDRAAKKSKVRINQLPTIKRTLNVEDPRGMLKSAQKLDLPDVECFTRRLDHVEEDIARVKVLANAWSRGDIEKLTSLFRNRPLQESLNDSCTYVLMSALDAGDSSDAAHAKKMLDDTLWHLTQGIVQSQQDWLAAAQTALAKNRSTFAVLGVAQVLSPDGHLEKLRALGYQVEAPQKAIPDEP